MTPLEPNPLSIRHEAVFAEFCELGMSRVKTADKKLQIGFAIPHSMES